MLGIEYKELHYYTTGCFTPDRFSGIKTNSDTIDFLGKALCHKSAALGESNCCGTDSSPGCNLPAKLRLHSFYASFGPKEIANALENDAEFRATFSEAGGFGRLGAGEAREAASLSVDASSASSSLILAASVGALCLAFLAIAGVLLAVCLCQRRRCQSRRQGHDPLTSSSSSSGCSGGKSKSASTSSDPTITEKLLRPTPSSASSTYASSSASSGGGVGGRSFYANGIGVNCVVAPNNSCAGVVGNGGDSLPSTKTSSSFVQHPDEAAAADGAGSLSGSGGLADNSQTGSGAGLPILVPRTVAREVELRELIGQGRFGQVFRAVWRNDLVAVKIFSSRAESSWSAEGHMYGLPGMRHDSVLGFIAIDNIDIGLETQLWLITDYHAHGSLQNFLTKASVGQLTMARMLASIASGLAHLHSEITGVKCKPAIAHRDVKSNNILVKADLTCCIADFGLAVAFHPGSAEAPAVSFAATAGTANAGSDPGAIRVGTRRYLSPECLDGSLAAWDFTGLRKADVYAMGLVFWELAARCEDPTRGVSAEAEYRQPYHSLVSANPSLEEMQSVVCQPAGARPEFAPAWLGHPVLGRLCRVMTECWYASPAARLEAMSVKDQAAKMLATAQQLAESDAVAAPAAAVASSLVGGGAVGGAAIGAGTVVA